MKAWLASGPSRTEFGEPRPTNEQAIVFVGFKRSEFVFVSVEVNIIQYEPAGACLSSGNTDSRGGHRTSAGARCPVPSVESVYPSEEAFSMNRWKNYVWLAAGVAAIAVVGSFTARPVIAQIKAAFVQNVNEPGLNPYQYYVSFKQGFVFPNGAGACNGAICSFTLPAVPAGKRLVVTNITGNIFVDNP